MAELSEPTLEFQGGCPDCGERVAVLPIPIPDVANDFDWNSRDYDSFRLFMMQELAHRFPDRRRWTPADMEVVIVELLAAALDRTSHALDAVQAERYLETARRPQSVRRLLKLIGYDAAQRTDPAILQSLPPAPGGIAENDNQKLERYWRLNPAAMETARQEGPRLTGEVRRMVTLADHETLIEEHPLVARTRARLVWSGAWYTILVATLLEKNKALDDPLHIGGAPINGIPSEVDKDLWNKIVEYHRIERLALPPVNEKLTARRLLRAMIEQNRMVGSEVFLETAKAAPITLALSVRVKKGYFRSELKQALNQVFTADEGGFFEPGRLGFGEDLFVSDIIEAAMAVEGVEVACLNRFKRVGAYPDRTTTGVIEIADEEFVLCENDPTDPSNGTYRITVNAGEVT
ncbi:MAG: hypothetical protein NPIRA02_09680 [Nitrospirales bacterium]|nr:MAG: hypothetical protein NPIRA02_09680 [Nitrospirales bacterium]